MANISNAISAYGLQLKRGDGATPTETFTAIAEITDLPAPPLVLDSVEVTPHNGSGWKEFVATLLEVGEFTITVNYLPGDSDFNSSGGLAADMINRTLRNFQIVYPDTGSSTLEFSAYVTGIEPTGAVGDALQASVTFRPSGEPTIP